VKKLIDIILASLIIILLLAIPNLIPLLLLILSAAAPIIALVWLLADLIQTLRGIRK